MDATGFVKKSLDLCYFWKNRDFTPSVTFFSVGIPVLDHSMEEEKLVYMGHSTHHFLNRLAHTKVCSHAIVLNSSLILSSGLYSL